VIGIEKVEVRIKHVREPTSLPSTRRIRTQRGPNVQSKERKHASMYTHSNACFASSWCYPPVSRDEHPCSHANTSSLRPDLSSQANIHQACHLTYPLQLCRELMRRAPIDACSRDRKALPWGRGEGRRREHDEAECHFVAVFRLCARCGGRWSRGDALRVIAPSTYVDDIDSSSRGVERSGDVVGRLRSPGKERANIRMCVCVCVCV
jgi:hypothetical protein